MINDSRSPRPSRRPTRDEHGTGTILIIAAIMVALMLGTAAVFVAGYRASAIQARSAADSAALSGALAVYAGGDGCAQARRTAQANDTSILECSQVGDKVDFVVSVRVSAPVRATVAGLPRTMVAVAHAGRLEAAQGRPAD